MSLTDRRVLSFIFLSALLPSWAAADAASDAKKAAEWKAKTQKEIKFNMNKSGDEKLWDCNLQWVRHQDFFGISGIEGDLSLQFHIISHKTADGWKPIHTTMVVTIFGHEGEHKDNNGGVITVDGRPITFESTPAYHTDTPMGITQKQDRLEVMDFPISYEDFAAIASGKKVKGRMAGIDFEVKDFKQAVFREMMDESLPTGTAEADSTPAAAAP
jgi:hypothetical protein